MVTGWPSIEDYKTWARIEDGVDDAVIARALGAVNAHIAGQATLLEPDEELPDDLLYACLLLTNRLLARRNSPEGVVGSNDGTVVTIGRYDPDVARLVGPYIGAKLA